MIYAEKGNRVIQIGDYETQKYAEQGYKIIDEWGKVIIDSVPTDIPTLRTAYKQQQSEIKKLTDEIQRLKQENSDLLKALSTADKKAKEVTPKAEEVKQEEVEEVKPKSTATKGKKKAE